MLRIQDKTIDFCSHLTRISTASQGIQPYARVWPTTSTVGNNFLVLRLAVQRYEKAQGKSAAATQPTFLSFNPMKTRGTWHLRQNPFEHDHESDSERGFSLSQKMIRARAIAMCARPYYSKGVRGWREGSCCDKNDVSAGREASSSCYICRLVTCLLRE